MGDLGIICTLLSSSHYKSIMNKVDLTLASEKEDTYSTIDNLFENNPIHSLLIECVHLIINIDNEIALAHNFNRDNYRSRFPELESLMTHPIDYARVVQKIGKQEIITQVDLEGIIPPSNIMVLTVTASTTTGKPLTEDQLQKVLEASRIVLQLDSDKCKIHSLVEKKMNLVAPNLSALLGPSIAANLVGFSNGLINLSKIPACNIQVLGAKKKNLARYNNISTVPYQSFISSCEIIQQTPSAWKKKALRLIAAKSSLLSKIDAFGQDPKGNIGRTYRNELILKIEKWQQKTPYKFIKPLPVPDGDRKKQRAGRRRRMFKESCCESEISKSANRISFNGDEEEILVQDETIGKNSSSLLRMKISHHKKKLIKVKENTFQRPSSTKGAIGSSSSLSFTPIQGIELSNPLPSLPIDTTDGSKSYFSDL